MFNFKSKKSTKNLDKTNTVKLDGDCDYRYVSPLDAEKIDLSMITHESNFEFLTEAKPDDRVPDYRDPLIKAHLNSYLKYLEFHKLKAKKQWNDIKNGAAVQAKRAQAEIDYIAGLDLDKLL